MLKFERMQGEHGTSGLKVQRLATAVVDLQDRLDQLETQRKEPSGVSARNLVRDRLRRVHRKLAARLQLAEQDLESIRR